MPISREGQSLFDASSESFRYPATLSLLIYESSLDNESHVPFGGLFSALSPGRLFLAAVIAQVLADAVDHKAGIEIPVSQFIAVEWVLRDAFEISRHKVSQFAGQSAGREMIALDRKTDLGGAKSRYGSCFQAGDSRKCGHYLAQHYAGFGGRFEPGHNGFDGLLTFVQRKSESFEVSIHQIEVNNRIGVRQAHAFVESDENAEDWTAAARDIRAHTFRGLEEADANAAFTHEGAGHIGNALAFAHALDKLEKLLIR
jgi:hypothetical protein